MIKIFIGCKLFDVRLGINLMLNSAYNHLPFIRLNRAFLDPILLSIYPKIQIKASLYLLLNAEYLHFGYSF